VHSLVKELKLIAKMHDEHNVKISELFSIFSVFLLLRLSYEEYGQETSYIPIIKKATLRVTTF
jgi:hypothetical protein